MSKCPKCGGKIKATYIKQDCPHCGVNLLYYKMDERLEADAEKAKKEVDAVNKFADTIKSSAIASPLHIIRLVLFFTPLASMCLPMLWAGHKNVSLITFIMSIINHGFDLGAIASDRSYLFAVLSMVMVIVLSIAEIICSLFSSAKNGFKRNISVWVINFLVLCILAMLSRYFGGVTKIGLIVTLVIYIIKAVLHCIIGKVEKKRIISAAVIFLIIPCIMLVPFDKTKDSAPLPAAGKNQIGAVSFNVASAFGTSLEDTDSMDRCSRFADYMNGIKPDFIGTQEMNEFWMKELQKEMPDYQGYGIVRGGDSEAKNSEMNSIFWLRDKYTEVEKNTIWLSETPDTESKYTYIDSEGNEAEAGCNRICTYAVLKDRDGRLYALMNTHLDNASEEARVFGANVVLSQINKIYEKYDSIQLVLTGDFNETAEDEAVKLLSSKFNISGSTDGSHTATYQEWGYRNTGDMPIDFIFTDREQTDYQVLDDISSGYVSDHYGIFAAINK